MTERKLATIRRIKQLKPIDGADMIELAIVDGWQVVVKKGEYKENDFAIYLEIDSWVPTRVAPFLTSEGKEPKVFEGVPGERLKTIKLRKQLSQGLLLPVPFGTYAEGDDVTEQFGILKWEPPAEKGNNTGTFVGGRKGGFPTFIYKTDQERIQNYGALVENALDEEFEVTMKKDGSSMTVFRVAPNSKYYEAAKRLTAKKLTFWQKLKAFFIRKQDEVIYGICSRNLLLPLEGTSNFHVAAAPVIEAMKKDIGSYAIQGEVVAPNIQDNHEQVKEIEFHVFDVFDINAQKYFLPSIRRKSIRTLGLRHVTVLQTGVLRDILLQPKSTEELIANALTYAEGPGDNKGVKREGVVFKNTARDLSFKAISNSYLLKKG